MRHNRESITADAPRMTPVQVRRNPGIKKPERRCSGILKVAISGPYLCRALTISICHAQITSSMGESGSKTALARCFVLQFGLDRGCDLDWRSRQGRFSAMPCCTRVAVVCIAARGVPRQVAIPAPRQHAEERVRTANDRNHGYKKALGARESNLAVSKYYNYSHIRFQTTDAPPA